MTNRKYYSDDAKQAARVEKTILGLSGLVAGIGIGGALGLLFAPEEGDKIRERLKEAVEDRTEQGKEKLTEVIQSIEEEYPDFSERITQAVDSMNSNKENA